MAERRSPKPEVVGSIPAAPAKDKKESKMASPAEFIRQVKAEANKVTWSTRKEVIMSVLVVLMMVGLAALFFMAVDFVIFFAVQKILGLEL